MRSKGTMCRTLEGHGHWVNTLALNSDYVIRTGAFDPKDATLFRNTSDLSSTISFKVDSIKMSITL
jgi:ribosome assembly protein 4